jgi:DNA-binding CsgD family transcriptional regulator
MTPPLVVVEGSQAVVELALGELRTAGWSIIEGWTAPLPRVGRFVRFGVVANQDDAEAAVLAVLSGVGIVAAARASRDLVDRLVDDLRHLGPIDHRLGEPPLAVGLPDESRAILGLLAEGYSLGEAAGVLGLSRRTADRRLADVRRLLGVERTTEAVALARRRGWLGRSEQPGTHTGWIG